MPSRWAPLHVHSQYSILTASAPVKKIASLAAEEGMPAVALTDLGNLFGAVEFYKACCEAGVKPIIGCDMYVAPGSRLEKKKEGRARSAYGLVLLAKNRTGYHNLCKLSSIGYLEGFYYYPRIDREVLEKYSEGLICLTGGLDSRLAHEILNGTDESVREHVEWHKALFEEDFYLELQRQEMEEELLHEDGIDQESWLLQKYKDYEKRQREVNGALAALSKEHGIACVAANNSFYIAQSDWRAHEILINVQSGEPCEIWETDSYGKPKFRTPNPKRRTFSSHQHHFRSSKEMEALFSDLPEALAASLEIAKKCDLKLDFETKHYPIYLPPSLKEKSCTKEERAAAAEAYLRQLCEEGIARRYTPERLAKVKEVYPEREPMEVVRERLEREMGVIAPKGMCDYLLIVWDFINWAKKNGVPVGPGRGSGAGSIVLYLIGVTDIEPLRFHLFFERFINPERLSYPDIDVDICMDRRGDVIQYTLEKYGKENVAQIITFGTMKARMAIKDVGRVLSVPLAKVNDIAKQVPDDLNITLERALEVDPDLRRLYEQDEEAKRVIDIGMKLEGSIRNTGIHAAGIIISGDPLTEYIPLCNAKESEMPVTQYSMKPVEQVGMLKIDFLGLKTLTAIRTCATAIEAATGRRIDWVDLPLDDKRTFELLNQGRTLGVFQLESGGMQDLARQLHLDRFEEIIAVGALYRPGPMDMIPSFINRKHGREKIEYDHEWMRDILAETYGIMVYQEQVMQIASKLANYSLGEGDVLRRAMGKKDAEQMAKQREKFRKGALENGIAEETSMRIFDKMEKFAQYGFNKSHAAAYGYLSYVTAYFKANYPKEWMAALMTCDSDDISKVAKFISECQAMKIAMLPPDINEAGQEFVAAAEGIRFAMSAIRGVGTGVVDAIVGERKKNGPFKSLYEFLKRIDKRTVGKKTVEHLIEAGCFDNMDWSRDALLTALEEMFDQVVKEQKEKAAGVLSLFSLIEGEEQRFDKPPKVASPRPLQEVLLKEKELLGFFLTGHPMDQYKEILRRLSCIPLRKMPQMAHSTIFRTAFIVEELKTKISQRTQKKFAILTISDGLERHELPVWPELYEQKGELLRENQLLYAVLHYEEVEGAPRLSCRWLDDLTAADEAMMRACDEAYDRAKMQAARTASRPRGATKKSEPKRSAKPPLLSVKLDANAARHSHIVKIKEIFSENRGPAPLVVDFLVGEKPIAHLHLEGEGGVAPSEELKQKLKEITAVGGIEVRYEK